MRKLHSLGPIISEWELSLLWTVVFCKRRPPTNCRDPRFCFPTAGRPFFCLEAVIEISSVKSQARKLAATARARAHASLSVVARQALAETGLAFLNIPGKKIVSGFIPYRSEIDVTGLLGVLADNGHTTCLPIVVGDGQPLIFRKWQPGDDTEPGAWNIPVPLQTAEPVEPDILLVPLLAFDKSGFRLGYGGGFYDRTISTLRKSKTIITIGAAYSAQEISQVPVDEHDQQLDWILTEKGPIQCG